MDENTIIDRLKEWLQAVIIQSTRIMEPESVNSFPKFQTKSIDARFFSIALLNYMKWAKHLKSIRPDLAQILDNYVSNYNEAKDLRDMLEHEDDYLSSKGKKQSKFLKQISLNNGRIYGGLRPQVILVTEKGFSMGDRVSVDNSLLKAIRLYKLKRLK